MSIAEEIRELHANAYPNHFVIQITRKQRFWNWFTNYNWLYYWRFTGAFIVFQVLRNHFNIEFSVIESAFLGFGMGVVFSY